MQAIGPVVRNQSLLEHRKAGYLGKVCRLATRSSLNYVPIICISPPRQQLYYSCSLLPYPPVNCKAITIILLNSRKTKGFHRESATTRLHLLLERIFGKLVADPPGLSVDVYCNIIVLPWHQHTRLLCSLISNTYR
jgi:hypothetical protein